MSSSFANMLAHDPTMMRRITEFLKSGSPVLGNRVRSSTLVKVIMETPQVSGEVKEAVVSIFETSLIQGQDMVEAFAIGLLLNHIEPYIPTPDFRAFFFELRDQNKLPLVTVAGRPVS